MKIAQVIYSIAPKFGGPSRVCIELTRALMQRGHEVTILTTDFGLSKDELYSEELAVDIRMSRSFGPALWPISPGLILSLLQTIPHVDIVHIHTLYHSHILFGGTISLLYNVPFILRPHGSLYPYHRNQKRLKKFIPEILYQNYIVRRAAAIQFTAESEAVESRPYIFGTNELILPLGVDSPNKSVQKGNFRARYERLSDARIVLFLSRLQEKKGLDVLAMALPEIINDRPDVMIVVAGPDDGMRKPFEKMVEAVGLLDRVIFTGMLEADEKWAAFADADVFVLPSYYENFGLSVVEALLAGCASVVSSRVAIAKELSAESAAWVVNPDPEAVGTAIGALLDDPQRRRALARHGADYAHKIFAWESIIPTYEDAYERIVARKN